MTGPFTTSQETAAPRAVAPKARHFPARQHSTNSAPSSSTG